MTSNSLLPISLDNIDEIIEFCINEIALEGLEGKISLKNLFLSIQLKSFSKGCKLTNLFDLFYESSCQCVNILNETNNSNSTRINNLFTAIRNNNDYSIRNFIWKLIVSQPEINFYLLNRSAHNKASTSAKNNKKQNESKIINDNDKRGYCSDYFKREQIDNIIKNESIKQLQDCLDEYDITLILVANQQTRNKTLCPAYKFLDFECINDLEYCILEKIAK